MRRNVVLMGVLALIAGAAVPAVLVSYGPKRDARDAVQPDRPHVEESVDRSRFDELMKKPSPRRYRTGGVIRDHSGKAVSGASVRVAGMDSTWTSTSDSDGRFVVDGIGDRSLFGDRDLEEGHHDATIDADGLLQWKDVLVCGAMDQVVELRRPAFIEGRALKPDGSAAVWASVGDATADAAGSFRTQMSPDETTVLATWTPTGGDMPVLVGRAPCSLHDGETVRGVEIRLAPLSFAVVRVLDAAGDPVKDVGSHWPHRTRGDDVVLAFEDAPGTERAVYVEGIIARPQFSDFAVDVVTQASPNAPPVVARLPVPREVVVDVRAADGGELPEQAAPVVGVVAYGDEVLRRGRVSTTIGLGGAKQHPLCVEAVGYAPVRRALTDAEIASRRVVVRLGHGATLRGRLASSDPLAVGALIGIVGLNCPHTQTKDGAFRVEHVPAGEATLTATCFAPNVVRRRVSVSDGDDIDLGDILVPPSRVVRGVVQTPDGVPCADAALIAYREGEIAGMADELAKEDGSFEIVTTSASGVDLVVRRSHTGAAVVRLDEVDPSKPLIVRLSRGGELDVLVRPPHGGPPSSAWGLRSLDGAVDFAPETRQAGPRRDDERRIVYARIPPGRWIVKTSDGREREVEVVADRTVSVVVD